MRWISLTVLLLLADSLTAAVFKPVLPLTVHPIFRNRASYFRLSCWNGDIEAMRSGKGPQGSIILRLDPVRSRVLRWGGFSWTFPEYNWGNINAAVDLRGARQLVVVARALKPGMRIVVSFGGNYHLYPDTASRSGGIWVLTGQWKPYSISLDGLDLSRISRLLTIVLRKEDAQDESEPMAVQIRMIRVE